MPLKDIQNKYNLSARQLTNINTGKYCYNGQHPYYKGIYTENFPIRKATNITLTITKEAFLPILKDCLYTQLSMSKLGEKYNYSANTLQYIFMGKRHKELTKEYLVPIRQHLQENR